MNPIEIIIAVVVVLLGIGLWYTKVFSAKKKATTTATTSLPIPVLDGHKVTKQAILDLVVSTKAKMISCENVFLATHPDTAKIVLKEDTVFEKKGSPLKPGYDLMIRSMSNVNGDEFRKLKAIMGPTFHYDHVKSLVAMFARKTTQVLDKWQNNGIDVCVRPTMSDLTLDIIGLTAFSENFDCVGGKNSKFLEAYNIAIPRITRTQDSDIITQARETITQLTYDLIDKKKKELASSGSSAGPDFLDKLIQADLPLSQMRDNIVLLFFGGHETSSNGLTWGIYYLATHPEYQQKAIKEVDDVLKGEVPTPESVKSLTFIDMFTKEVLRIKPPVANLPSRCASEPFQVGDYTVPKGMFIGISIYTIHHLEEFWPDPEKFDPYRFSSENSANRYPNTYMPFSVGSRACPGNTFSMLELKIFFAMLLQRFTVTLSKKCLHDDVPTMLASIALNVVADFHVRTFDK